MPAIYQRARPTRFEEVVGQEHVTSLLAAALRRDVVGHAYLFSGPRGVGKTTSARLLAMAVNCEAPSERPCGRCDACRAVQQGSHPDVIELDAASNNSVDDVRELREQVRLAPLHGGRRVWILDEAHMLSRAAANALLKTLEEPPPGLLFVLATTEPEKLPATVLSRCQHFRFRRLSDGEIRGKLERLVRESGTHADAEALDLLARAADGAMRDAESMLERLLASGGDLTRASAEAALGLPPRERMATLAQALADGDLAQVLGAAADLYADGFAPRTLAEQLGRTLRDALVARVRSEALDGLDLDADEDALIRALHVLDDAHERFVRRGDLYALEVTLIRAATALRSAATAAAAAAAVAREHPPTHAPAVTRSQAAAPPAPPVAATRSETPAPDETPREAAAAPEAFDPNARPRRAPAREQGQAAAGGRAATALSWHALLGQAGPQLKAFLLPAQARIEGQRLEIRYDERHTFHFAQLQRREQALYDLLDGAGGASLAVSVFGPGGSFQRPAGGPAVGTRAVRDVDAAASGGPEQPSDGVAEAAAAPPEGPPGTQPLAASAARAAPAREPTSAPPAPPAAADAVPPPLPASDTIEALPDGFWSDDDDAGSASGSTTEPGSSAPRAAAPESAARVADRASGMAPQTVSAPLAADGDEQHDGSTPQVVAELQRLFPGRVLRVERVDDTTVDDGASASTDPESADVDADTPVEHDAADA